MLQLILNSENFVDKCAILDKGVAFRYADLHSKSAQIASKLLNGEADLQQKRVAFMVSPGFDYVAFQWGIWRAGGVAVPLCITYPLPSLKYVIEDTGAEIVIAGPEYVDILIPLVHANTFKFYTIADFSANELSEFNLPEISTDRNAMILYTSGTTSLPKGVVTSHANLEAQISTLVKAWHWTSADHTVCVLPLHHVHGIINVISCALWAGATVEFLEGFSPEKVFGAFAFGKINVFMAVPTIYFKLITYWDNLPDTEKAEITENLQKFRLMVSGSAALPVSVMEKWQEISGHTLLERYGMTEIGMGISNPYEGERKAGYIGKPLPGVSVRLIDEYGVIEKEEVPGEIQIKGANVFKEYWGKAEATEKAFTEDGWFKTGDVAVVENGYYRILGRDSVDIIKSGGYKISALEIEEVLRKHPQLNDCAVVGIPDDEWGELVVASIVVRNKALDLKQLNEWMRGMIPAYKTPRKYLIVEELPRNAMGKVTKNDVKELFKNI
ncbi:acyl-CoA synthetase [Lacihabitans soyangensis]|uniref:Long-chain fatty acid--CoA ligase n=1 Tax=Lacihabitans soyangensis TaxID=869394 RepID=A0AAE3H8I4_9BACT|nr:acyl-CoA synthetase [Lacihabitans soyangensis]MCP9766141.1 long-chain fatty acid--CoA ligase [Lacihabitans soyangensis]